MRIYSSVYSVEWIRIFCLIKFGYNCYLGLQSYNGYDKIDSCFDNIGGKFCYNINNERKGVEYELHSYGCHQKIEEGDYTVALQHNRRILCHF